MEAGGRAAISVGTRPRWPRENRSLLFKHHAARRYRIPRRDIEFAAGARTMPAFAAGAI